VLALQNCEKKFEFGLDLFFYLTWLGNNLTLFLRYVSSYNYWYISVKAGPGVAATSSPVNEAERTVQVQFDLHW
jgi:hypothetical protein